MVAFPTFALAFITLTPAADPPKEPVQPLAEYARRINDPDWRVRQKAAEGIRDHYRGKSLEILPQVIEALGEELDRWVKDPKAPNFRQEMWQAADGAGPGRVKVAGESTRHPDPKIRAAGFLVWGMAAFDKEAGVDADELLAAVRRGLKDTSPMVRTEAVNSLRHLRDYPPAVPAGAVKMLAAALGDQVESPGGGNRPDNPAVMAAHVLVYYRAKAKPALEALIKATGSRDPWVISMSCRALNSIAEADQSVAEEVVKVLRSIFTDKKQSETVRDSGIRSLLRIGPAARWAIPDLVDLLDDPKTSSDLRRAAVTVFMDMGPRAAPSVLALVRFLEWSVVRWDLARALPAHRAIGSTALWLSGWDRGVEELNRHELSLDLWLVRDVELDQALILNALKAIGPAAAPAAGPLKRYMEKVQNSPLEKLAYDALVAIEK